MRRSLATALLVLALGVTSHAATVAWYQFEEGSLGAVASGVLDSSGNALHGTPYGTNGPVYATGLAPLSPLGLALDGVDDWFFVPDDPKMELTESFTIEAFVNIDGVTTDGIINFIAFRGDTVDGYDSFIFGLRSATEELRFYIDGPDGSGGLATSVLDIPFTWFGETIHVAGVFDGSTGFQAVYVNGELKASTTTPVRPRGPLNPAKQPGLGIGNWWSPRGGGAIRSTVGSTRSGSATRHSRLRTS